jgi:hypothetical protein
MKYLALLLVALPFAASAAEHPRHDTVKNAIRDVRATVDTTTHTIGHTLTTIQGLVGDPIPGCVGRVCGGI